MGMINTKFRTAVTSGENGIRKCPIAFNYICNVLLRNHKASMVKMLDFDRADGGEHEA